MLTVAAWNPPFDVALPTGFVRAPNVQADHGSVLLVRLTDVMDGSNGDGGDGIPALVRDLRRRHPASPVALWIDAAPPQVVIDAVRAASQAQVRAIVGGESPPAGLLRSQLTHPGGISAFVLRWASDAGYLPPGMEQEDVRELLDAAPDVRTLERLSVDRQMAARTWRSRLQQLGLPNPRAWLGLAHGLHVAFYVQRNHTESLQALCDQLGMLTVANMSQQFRRVFGLSPGQVRDLLGAEPLLHRWFQARARP
jgi:AraC-like DNA-binding protein